MKCGWLLDRCKTKADWVVVSQGPVRDEHCLRAYCWCHASQVRRALPRTEAVLIAMKVAIDVYGPPTLRSASRRTPSPDGWPFLGKRPDTVALDPWRRREVRPFSTLGVKK